SMRNFDARPPSNLLAHQFTSRLAFDADILEIPHRITRPLLAAVWSRVVLHHQVARAVWFALGLALVGLATVAQVWSDTGLDGVGVAAGLGAACCLAAFYLLSKHALTTRGLQPLTLALWMFVTAAIWWAVVQPWWQFDASSLGDRVSLQGALEDVAVALWLPVAWIIVLATLVPYALALAALAHLSPTTTGIVGMSEPVVAAAVAWFWLGQALSAIQLLGAGLVLVAVAIVQVRGTPPAGAERSSGLQHGAQTGEVGRPEHHPVAGRDVDEVEVDAGGRHLAGEVGEHARAVVDVDHRDLPLARDREVRDRQHVLGRRGVGDEDVQLRRAGRTEARRRGDVDPRIADRLGDLGERTRLVLDLDDQIHRHAVGSSRG
ncbi:MAG TPA: DMT family transporter, partial [Ilumatobacteraceae bacterium]|nr:DMT family transporter [Ilumatobacteraceae bacterium]